MCYMKWEHIHKHHNVNYLLYHFVCPIKNRLKVLRDDHREKILKEICIEIESNYEIYFLEIWTDKDHVHFLIQSVPSLSATSILRILKSITWREMFKRVDNLRKELMWWNFWTSGYYVNTVWKYGSEWIIREYVKNQWKKNEYRSIHVWQLRIFDIP